MKPVLWILPFVAFSLLFPCSSWAGEHQVEAVRESAGKGFLGIVFTPGAKLSSLELKLECTPDGGGDVHRVSKKKSPVASGVEQMLDLGRPAEGTLHCTGALTIVDQMGGEGSMPLDLSFTRRPALRVELPKERVNLDQRELYFHADQVLDEARLEVLGPQGSSILAAEPRFEVLEDGWVRASWQQAEVEVLLLKLEVKAGVVSYTTELSPWRVEIPHEKIIFDSGKANVRADQDSKLDATYTLIDQAVRTYGHLVEVKLYVVGFTDTVGAPESNKDLSFRRATSIARAFVRRGFTGPVFVAGLGETGLALPTPDEVDEEANRRAVYILAVEPPAPGEGMPLPDWKALK